MSTHRYNHQKTPLPFSIYRAFDAAGDLLYVGISTSPKRRAVEQRSAKLWWRDEVAGLDVQLIGARPIAQAVEAVAIREENPRYNELRAGSWSTVHLTLAQYMQDEGLSKEQLAQRQGVDVATVQKWLSGPPRYVLPPRAA